MKTVETDNGTDQQFSLAESNKFISPKVRLSIHPLKLFMSTMYAYNWVKMDFLLSLDFKLTNIPYLENSIISSFYRKEIAGYWHAGLQIFEEKGDYG